MLRGEDNLLRIDKRPLWSASLSWADTAQEQWRRPKSEVMWHFKANKGSHNHPLASPHPKVVLRGLQPWGVNQGQGTLVMSTWPEEWLWEESTVHCVFMWITNFCGRICCQLTEAEAVGATAAAEAAAMGLLTDDSLVKRCSLRLDTQHTTLQPCHIVLECSWGRNRGLLHPYRFTPLCPSVNCLGLKTNTPPFQPHSTGLNTAAGFLGCKQWHWEEKQSAGVRARGEAVLTHRWQAAGYCKKTGCPPRLWTCSRLQGKLLIL